MKGYNCEDILYSVCQGVAIDAGIISHGVWLWSSVPVEIGVGWQSSLTFAANIPCTYPLPPPELEGLKNQIPEIYRDVLNSKFLLHT